MRLVPDSQVDLAAYLVDTGQVVQWLKDALAQKPQGRPRQLTLRTWLIGAVLAVLSASSYKTTTIHQTLTSSISIKKQWELGVRYRDKNGEVKVLSKSRFDYIPRMLRDGLACTPTSVVKWDLAADREEQRRRLETLHCLLDQMLSASIVDEGTGWYALDGSEHPTWAKSKFKLDDEEDVRAQEEVYDDPYDVNGEDGPHLAASDDGDEEESDDESKRRPWKDHADPDARVGSKTGDMGGREPYYGYVIDAAVQTRRPGQDDPHPVVIERVRVSPANADVVQPSLSMLDSMLAEHGNVTDITVDRHYSHKQVHRWADELAARRIDQHFDMRSDDQGFTDIDGMRFTAGWMHCPATPDELDDIPRPGPGASKEKVEAFNRKIAERETWAMDRHEAVGTDGRTRWKCPAMAGKRGCPLREGTVQLARENGLPIVSDPPEDADNLACCTNSSGITSDRSARMRKHQQPHYWGSPEWKLTYDLRTYVEGLFGSVKNRDTEDIGRGFTKFVGLPMVTLGVAIAAAVCNVRHQRKFWADRDDAPDHPLLQPDPDFHGWNPLTHEEAADQDRLHDTARDPDQDAA